MSAFKTLLISAIIGYGMHALRATDIAVPAPDEMLSSADVVVVATISKKEGAWTLVLKEVLKGSHRQGDKVTLSSPYSEQAFSFDYLTPLVGDGEFLFVGKKHASNGTLQPVYGLCSFWPQGTIKELLPERTLADAVARAKKFLGLTVQHSSVSESNTIATASEMRSAYTTLAQATKLPGGEVDSTGKRLPQKFEEYLGALRNGPDTFYEGLSDECKAAFLTIKQSAEHHGIRGVVDLVQFASKTSHPSMFDVWLSWASADYLSEYPLEFRNAADPGLWAKWASLADSQNPIYRLLALTQARRLTTNAGDLSSFLAKYLDEEDARMVHPLIYHLLEVGGPSAEESLKVISKRALERGDKKTSELATETLAKLRVKECSNGHHSRNHQMFVAVGHPLAGAILPLEP